MGTDEEDIYGDLPEDTTADYIRKLEVTVEEQKKQIEELNNRLEDSKEKSKELNDQLNNSRSIKNTLETNISALFLTAQHEVERYKNRISELQREKDDLIFRRCKKQNGITGSDKSVSPAKCKISYDNSSPLIDINSRHLSINKDNTHLSSSYSDTPSHKDYKLQKECVSSDRMKTIDRTDHLLPDTNVKDSVFSKQSEVNCRRTPTKVSKIDNNQIPAKSTEINNQYESAKITEVDSSPVNIRNIKEQVITSRIKVDNKSIPAKQINERKSSTVDNALPSANPNKVNDLISLKQVEATKQIKVNSEYISPNHVEARNEIKIDNMYVSTKQSKSENYFKSHNEWMSAKHTRVKSEHESIRGSKINSERESTKVTKIKNECESAKVTKIKNERESTKVTKIKNERDSVKITKIKNERVFANQIKTNNKYISSEQMKIDQKRISANQEKLGNEYGSPKQTKVNNKYRSPKQTSVDNEHVSTKESKPNDALFSLVSTINKKQSSEDPINTNNEQASAKQSRNKSEFESAKRTKIKSKHAFTNQNKTDNTCISSEQMKIDHKSISANQDKLGNEYGSPKQAKVDKEYNSPKQTNIDNERISTNENKPNDVLFSLLSTINKKQSLEQPINTNNEQGYTRLNEIDYVSAKQTNIDNKHVSGKDSSDVEQHIHTKITANGYIYEYTENSASIGKPKNIPCLSGNVRSTEATSTSSIEFNRNVASTPNITSSFLKTPLKIVNGKCILSTPFSCLPLITPFKETPDLLKAKYDNNRLNVTQKSPGNSDIQEHKQVSTNCENSSNIENSKVVNNEKNHSEPTTNNHNVKKTFAKLFGSPCKKDTNHEIDATNIPSGSESSIKVVAMNNIVEHMNRKRPAISISSVSDKKICYSFRLRKN